MREGPAGTARAVERFCTGIIEAVAEHAVAIKPQLAFFEAIGPPALSALERICETARAARAAGRARRQARRHRLDLGRLRGGVPVARGRGLGPRGDALTVNPYLGDDGLEPFAATAREHRRGLFVLVRTSNPGSAALQELELAGGESCGSASRRSSSGIGRDDAPVSSIGAVVGATQPHVVGRARELMPRTPFLLPGIGAQGGDVAGARAGVRARPRRRPRRGVALGAVRRSGPRWQQAAAAEAARLQAASWPLVSV